MNRTTLLYIFFGVFVLLLAGGAFLFLSQPPEPTDAPQETIIPADEFDENTLTPQPIETDPLDEFPPGEPPDAAAGGSATMPREAAMACADLSVGDACTYETPGGMIEGTCEEVDGGVGCL